MKNKLTVFIIFFNALLYGQGQVGLVVQKGHTASIKNLSVSQNGKLLCSISADYEMIVWDVRSANIIATTNLPLINNKSTDTIDYFFSFKENNSEIAVSNNITYEVNVYSINNDSWSNSITKDNIRHKRKCKNSLAGDLLEVSNHKLYKFTNGSLQFKKTCQYFEKKYTSVDCNNTHSLIIAGCTDNKIYVYDYNSGKKIKLLSDHTGPVNDVVFSNDGNYFFSASSDRSIAMWDSKTFKIIKRFFKQLSSKTDLAIDPTQKYLYLGSEAGEIYRIEIASEKYASSYWQTGSDEITTIQPFNSSTIFIGTKNGYIKTINLDNNTLYFTKQVKAPPIVVNGTTTYNSYNHNIYKLMTIGHDRIPLKSIVKSSLIDKNTIAVDYITVKDPFFREDADSTKNISKWQTIIDSLGNKLVLADNSKVIKIESPYKKLPSKTDLPPKKLPANNLIYLQDCFQKTQVMIPLAKKNHIASLGKDGLLYFWNKGEGNLVAKVLLNKDDRIIFLPDNYYMSTNKSLNTVGFRLGTNYISPEQFDLKYNRPDIVLSKLGVKDKNLINAYYNAYLKRLKKMNFTEKMLQEDFHLPNLSVIDIESIPSITNNDKLELQLKLKDDKYKLDRVNIWVNDVAFYGKGGIDLRDKKTQEITTSVKVNLCKGKNKIQLSVLNQAGAESYKETIFIECTAGKEKPDLYIISIGVSEYQDKNYNLKFAAKDANDVVSTFKESTIYKTVYTKTLTNNQVTRESVVQLKDFLKAADINDQVIVFFAGHGVLDEKLDYFLASYDMDFNKPSTKGIAYEEIENLLDGIVPLKKIILLDACHSGEIDKDDVEITQTKTVKPQNITFRSTGTTVKTKDNTLGSKSTAEFTKSLFADLRKGTGATVISSAGGMEFAMESGDWNNGLFTYCLLYGLKTNSADLNGDKKIMLSELQDYVSKTVLEKSMGKQQPSARIENNFLNCRVW